MAKSPKKSFSKKAKKAAKPEVEFEFFCDFDGVLDDFDTHAKAEGKLDAKGNPKWDEMGYEWWSTIPAFDGAKEFYDELRGRGRTRGLTAPILNDGCFRGKAEWFKEFRRSRFALLDVIIAKADDKNLLARPNHILVDDRIKNVDAWNKAGGIGILHEGDYADTLRRVDAAMEKYKRENAPSLPPPPPVLENPGTVKVFIGTNGVLADFQTHLETEGKLDAKGKTKWTELDSEWFKTVPAYPGAKQFYNDVREAAKNPDGKSQVRFLTGPVPTPDGFAGGAEWTMGFRPESGKFALLDILVARSKDKVLLARPNNILIDDRKANVEAWQNAGGRAILHKGDYAETLKELKEMIHDYQNPKKIVCKLPPANLLPKPPKKGWK